MRLITRCPACQTLFKVVPDQLRISGGWVRCGQCSDIFDASLQLLPHTPEETIPNGNRTGDPSTPEIGSTEAAIESTRRLPDPVLQTTADAAPKPEPKPASTPELGAVAFLRTQRADSGWRRPFTRVLLSCLSVALLLTLAGQIVFHERNRIVALRPDLKPWLQAFCRPLNCSLSALQERNFIVIDSASFSRIARDSYRLNFALKNTSTLALAIPAIELTLTDSLDQPVFRRVFLSADLDLKSDTLAAGSEWSTSLALAVNLANTAQQIVGYRLYAFYP